MGVELAYKYNPSGQEGPNRKRDYIKPESPLEQALAEYLDTYIVTKYPEGFDWTTKDGSHPVVPRHPYEFAEKLLQDIEPTKGELDSILLKFINHPNFLATGLFLSAAHNKSDVSTVVFPDGFEEPVYGIGTFLREDKSLIVLGDTQHTGLKSRGIILNYGNTNDNMGLRSHGTLINYGNVEVLAEDAHSTAINFGYARDFAYMFDSMAINFGESMQFSDDGYSQQSGVFINDGEAESFVSTLSSYRCSHPATTGRAINLGEANYRTDRINKPRKHNNWLVNKVREIGYSFRLRKLRRYVSDLTDQIGPEIPPEEVIEVLRNRDIDGDIREILGVKND